MTAPEKRNNLKGKTGIRRILNATKYSKDGLKAAWIEEDAFRTMVIVAIIMIPLGLILGNNWTEKMILIFPLFLTLIVELLNSAIENCIDYISLEIHPLAKKAKDMGSAAQMITLCLITIVWLGWIITHYCNCCFH